MRNSLPFRSSRILGTALIAAFAAACSPPSPPSPPSASNAAASTRPQASPAVASTSAMGNMAMSTRDDRASGPTVVATATSTGTFGSGGPVTVLLHVHEAAGGKPMGPEAFNLEHTKTIHALAADPSLTDYSHEHPQFTGQAGTWTYTFTPRYNRAYHVWLDVTPVGGAQQYVMLALNEHGASVPVDTTLASSAVAGHLTAKLAFDGPLMAGQPAMGHVTVQRDGKPFEALEPVMGAYAHIVGIAQDGRSIAHVHPQGTEPRGDSERGGPRIDFHLEPAKAGFLKLFAQIQVDGHDVYLPFGVTVQPATPVDSPQGGTP